MDKNQKSQYQYSNNFRSVIYNGQGLTGLSSADRQEWEKTVQDQLNEINELPALQRVLAKDELFYNSVFSDIAKNTSNEEYKTELLTIASNPSQYTRQQKQQVLDKLALAEDIDGRSDAIEQKWNPLTVLGTAVNEGIKDAWDHAKEAGMLARIIFPAYEGQRKDVATELFNNYKHSIYDGNLEIFKSIQDAHNLAVQKVRAEKDPTARQRANQRLTTQADHYVDSVKKDLDKLSEDELNTALNELDVLSTQISNEYNNYYTKLDYDEQEKQDLLAKYISWNQVGGNTFANTKLHNEYIDRLESKQSKTEVALNSLESFNETFVSGAVSTIGALAGIGKGIWTFGEMLFSDNYDDYTQNEKDAILAQSWYLNDITEWAEALGSTGVWSREKQKEYLAKGMHDNPIFQTVAEQEQLLSWKTPAEVHGSSGYTAEAIASSLLGAGLIKWAGKAAKAGALASKTLNWAQKAEKLASINKKMKYARLSMPFVQSLGESSIEAVSTRNEVLQLMSADLDRKIQDLRTNTTKQIIDNSDPSEIIAKVNKYYPGFKQILAESGESSIILSDATKQRMADLLLSKEEFIQELDETLNIPEMISDAEQEMTKIAAQRGGMDYVTNIAILSASNYGGQLTMQAPSVQSAVKAAKRRAGRGSFLSDHLDFIQKGNLLQAQGKKGTVGQVISDRVKEIITEGFEEGGQGISSSYNNIVAQYQLASYLDAKYGVGDEIHAAVEDWTDSISDYERRTLAAAHGIQNLGTIAVDREIIKEAIYGALGTAFGSPTINTNVKWSKRNENESRLQYAQRLNFLTWRSAANPFNVKKEAKTLEEQNKQLAEYVNIALSNPNTIDILRTIPGTLAFAKKYNDAIASGDPELIQDAEFQNAFNLISTLISLGDHTYAQSMRSIIHNRTQLNPDNLSDTNSEESKVVLEYAQQNSKDFKTLSQKEKETILKDIIDSSTKIEDMINLAEIRLGKYDKIFGDDLSMQAKHVLLHQDFLIDNLSAREEQTEDSLREFMGLLPEASEPVHGSKAAYIVKALWGDKQSFLQAYNKLAEDLKTEKQDHEAALKAYKQNASLENLLNVVFTANHIKQIQFYYDKYNQFAEIIKQISDDFFTSDAVIPARDFFKLPAFWRNDIFNKFTEKKYQNSKQGQEIQQILKYATIHKDSFDVSNLISASANIEHLKNEALQTKLEYLNNPNTVQQAANRAFATAQRKMKEVQYKDFEDPNSEINRDFDTFRQNFLNKLSQLESFEDKDILKTVAERSPHWQKYEKDNKNYEELKREIKKTEIYQKLSIQEKDDLLVLLDTAFYKYGELLIANLSNNEFGTMLSSITEEDINNFINITNRKVSFANLGSAIENLVPAFNDVKKEAKKREARNTPTEVKKSTPENNTPSKSEQPVFEGPVVENSNANPTIVLSEEDLIKKGATPAMIKFYRDNNILDNITRLIAEGKLHSKSEIHKQATQVYFTVDKIGNSYEIIQLVEDTDGQYLVEDKRYSIIGIETNVVTFTTEDRKKDNVKKLLPKTASVTKVDTQRVTGESTNLKDIAPGHEDSVLKNLTVAPRQDSDGKTEMVYSSRTGRGGTVYTSSVSDTPIDQVKLTEYKTAIDLLFEYKNLPFEERLQKAGELLKHLDYSQNQYYYNQIVALIESIKGKNKLSAKEVAHLNYDINNIFKQLYFLGKASNERLTQFVFQSNDNTFSLQIKNEGAERLNTQERSTLLSELTQESFLEMFLSTLAEAAVDENGKPKAHSKKNYVLSFEIGLKDLEFINNPLALRGLSKKEAEEMSKRIGAKKGFLKEKIALGLLQITNNQADLSPKSIKVAFNYDGAITSDSQIIPEANSDTTESRSNTVETTTGEVVDGDTGITITPASNEVKITDEVEKEVISLKENESQPIDSNIDINNPLGIQPSESSTTVEEEEGEIDASEIQSSMANDDEFGSLYQIDKSQLRKDLSDLLFWHMNHPSIQAAGKIYEQQIPRIISNIKKQAVQIQKNESIEGAKFRMEQTVYQEAGEYKNLIKSIDTYQVGNYIHAKVSFYSHQDYMLAIVKNLYKDFNNEQIHNIVEDLKQREQEATDVSFQLNKKEYQGKITTGTGYARTIHKGIVESITKFTEKTPFVLTSISYSNKVNDLINRVSTVDIKEAKKVLGDVFAIIDNPTEVVSSVVKDHISSLVDKYVVQPANKDLSKKLRAILKKYHVDVFEGPLKEYFGQDVKGAFNFLYKIVALAEAKDRNALTEPEEFAHAFFALMGQSISSFSKDIGYHYKQLAQDIQKTDLYKQVLVDYAEVYGNNTQKYIDEALGKALGAVILEKEEINKNKSFFAKLKDFFNKILELFRKKENTYEFTPYVSLYDELSKMANSILDNSYQDTYLERYTKEEEEINNSVVDAIKTLEEQTKKDGGRTVNVISTIQKLGGTLGGSLALSRRGTVYRRKLNLHDLDFSIGPMIHRFPSNLFKASAADIAVYIENSAFIESVKALLPNFSYITAYRTDLGLTAHGFVSDSAEVANKFLRISGTLSEKLSALSKEEQNQISLIDFFFDSKEIDAVLDPELGRISTEKAPFLAKAYYGRLKDIHDYQRFKSNLSVKEKMDIAFNKRLQERIDIRSKAIEDGTWKKAPNGLPSKLSDEQWITVRTKAFKSWFGDWENDPSNASQVIDLDTKEPLLVYHGSNKTFSVFGDNITKHRSWTKIGHFYFTENKANAVSYGLHLQPVFLNIRKPSIYDFKGRGFRNTSKEWTLLDRTNGTVLEFQTEQAAQTFKQNYLQQYPEDIYKYGDPQEGTISFGKTTDELAEEAQKAGYDGAIQLNVIDTASLERAVQKLTANNYVVFNPNQIKSANSNIRAFDINNPDIRYQLAEDVLEQQSKEKVNSLQHSNNALIESWDWMSNKMQESLSKRGLSKEVWEQLTPEEREKAIECR